MLDVEYEYIGITWTGSKPKTEMYGVFNKKYGTWLGEIAWYAGWRQYCFFPEPQMVFSSGCMEDIVEFTKQLNKEHKNKTIK